MNEITKPQKVIKMRSGVEKYIDAEKAEILQNVLDAITSHKFIRVEGETLNTADMEGVYLATTLEDNTRRKNGAYKCKGANWHDKGEKCTCASLEEQKRAKMRDEAAKNCKICEGKRFVLTESGASAYCECQDQFV